MWVSNISYFHHIDFADNKINKYKKELFEMGCFTHIANSSKGYKSWNITELKETQAQIESQLWYT